MSNYNNQSNQNNKPVAPDWLINKAKGEMAIAHLEVEQAKKRINPKYHDFLVLLNQNVNLVKKEYAISGEASKLGMFSFNGATFVTISKPYITVDGRIQMARDEHKELEKKLDIMPPQILPFGERLVLSVDVVSEIYGKATGMIEINLGGNAVDKTNPFANAQTSAIGRALGFLGYGLVGTGIVDPPEEGNAKENPPKNELDEPPHSSPSSKAPREYRIKVLEIPMFERDGSAKVNVMMNDRSTKTLLLQKELVKFSERIQKNHVLIVKGWLDDNILKADIKTQPIIEQQVS
ncbi:hypothetical protein [Peribacillus asahii]|uniref:hypothetical protein n=1 Tax=Peribacillus asahii TaxID=228899 RepID=UPI00207AF847|nr:hypothetical protein [Peribacillus asahii]USK62304.1 hypothetical protein LIT37_24330 [Peribacillus asahii]